MSSEDDYSVFPGKDTNREIAAVLTAGLTKEGDVPENLSEVVGTDKNVLSPNLQDEIGGVEKESGTLIDLPTTELVSPPPEAAQTEVKPKEKADEVDKETPPLPKDCGTTEYKPNGVVDIPVALGEDVTLPNLTLGRGKDYIEYPLIIGITLNDEYAPDGRLWMNTRDVDIEKTDKGFKVTPKPGVTGTVSFDVFYNHDKKARFHLTINPDPWSLWTVKEPTESMIKFKHDKDRIKKRHQTELAYEDGVLTVFGASRRGRSHEHSGTFRDDDLGFWADEATGRYVFIVADGAGSAKFSREGARMAIEFLEEKLPANLTTAKWDADGDNPKKDGNVGQLLAALARHAFDYIAEVVKAENERTSDDKLEIRDFNTTLLIAALKRDTDGSMRLVTFSIGDGAIAWFDGERSELMCAPDGGDFSGGTRFLTMRSVWEKASKDWPAFCNARVFCKKFSSEEAKKMKLFLMTDGVSDPWFETDAALADTQMWRKFSEETLAGEGENQASIKDGDTVEVKAEKLLEWLNFKIAGNHDDRTLIVVSPKSFNNIPEYTKEVANA